MLPEASLHLQSLHNKLQPILVYKQNETLLRNTFLKITDTWSLPITTTKLQPITGSWLIRPWPNKAKACLVVTNQIISVLPVLSMNSQCLDHRAEQSEFFRFWVFPNSQITFDLLNSVKFILSKVFLLISSKDLLIDWTWAGKESRSPWWLPQSFPEPWKAVVAISWDG
jgi:hypothetical protein